MERIEACKKAKAVASERKKTAVVTKKKTPKYDTLSRKKIVGSDKLIIYPNGVHRVAAGQGIYAIAVIYNVTMADLRRWNRLAKDSLYVGQVLIVSETAFEVRKKRNNE